MGANDAKGEKQMKIDKQILTTAEAAEYLGVTPVELKRVMTKGHVRRLRGFHKPYRFSIFELDRYLREGLVLG